LLLRIARGSSRHASVLTFGHRSAQGADGRGNALGRTVTRTKGPRSSLTAVVDAVRSCIRPL